MLGKNFENDFPPLARQAYLDSASSGLLPKSSFQAMQDFLQEYYESGENWDYVLECVIACRRLFASLIKADFREVATAPNVSTALAIIASSIDFDDSSNVVVSVHNFPTNLDIWITAKKHGLVKEVRVARGYDDAVEELIDDKTRVVSVDAVTWLTGHVHDLRRLAKRAHEVGAILVSDIFHMAGVIPVDVHRDYIDVALCGSYKWLNAPPGVAFIYVRKELIESLKPRYIGWMGTRDSVINRLLEGKPLFDEMFNMEDPEPSEDASRFELGTWSSVSIVGVKASLEYHLSMTEHAKYEHVRKLVEKTYEGLAGMGIDIVETPSMISGILSFRARNPSLLAEAMKKENIMVSARPGIIRVSHHFYNKPEHVDRMLDCLRRNSDKL